MKQVTVYYFKKVDIQRGEEAASRRRATAEGIARCVGEPIFETAWQVDETDLDGNGFVKEGTAERVVRVHHLAPSGYQLEERLLGQDISPHQFEHFRDPQTDDMYALSLFEKGVLKMYFVKKQSWDDTKALLEERGLG